MMFHRAGIAYRKSKNLTLSINESTNASVVCPSIYGIKRQEKHCKPLHRAG
jgi:hypothetical protein